MAAMANILVKDDAATPIEHTLKPVTDTPNPYWRGSTAGVPFDGQPRFTLLADEVKSGAVKLTDRKSVV